MSFHRRIQMGVKFLQHFNCNWLYMEKSNWRFKVLLSHDSLSFFSPYNTYDLIWKVYLALLQKFRYLFQIQLVFFLKSLYHCISEMWSQIVDQYALTYYFCKDNKKVQVQVYENISNVKLAKWTPIVRKNYRSFYSMV